MGPVEGGGGRGVGEGCRGVNMISYSVFWIEALYLQMHGSSGE